MDENLKHLIRLAAHWTKAWEDEREKPDNEIDWDVIHELEDEATYLLPYFVQHLPKDA